MFTGLVSDLGVVERLEPRAGGARITIRPGALPVDELVPGESVACNGACLTVVERGGGRMSFDAVPETLARTTLGTWRSGTRVNLERALRLSDRLGGHLVQGHVDGVGRVLDRQPSPDGSVRLTIELPGDLVRYVVEKGSITVDGVSLTVTGVRDFDADGGGARFGVALVPHTLASTTLGCRRPGDAVNLEVDVLAKYVERLLTPVAATASKER